MERGPGFPNSFYLLLAAVVTLCSQRAWFEVQKISLWVKECLCCKTAHCANILLFLLVPKLFNCSHEIKEQNVLLLWSFIGIIQSTMNTPMAGYNQLYLELYKLYLSHNHGTTNQLSLASLQTACLSYMWRSKAMILLWQISFKFFSTWAQLIITNQLFFSTEWILFCLQTVPRQTKLSSCSLVTSVVSSYP